MKLILFPILSGLIGICVYACAERRKVRSERKIHMEKLVIIILALTIMVFAMPNQDAEQPPTQDLEMLQSTATESTPIEDTEKVDVGETEEITETNDGCLTEERPTEQDPPIKSEESIDTQPEETVECVDRGDQRLAEYKPQIGSQPNPFENAPPTMIIDQQVEDIIGVGEERPGEGEQF